MILRDYLKSINELIEEYPEALEMEVIYSHDDEGNEYQEVINLPSICKIEEHTGYRFLEMEGYLNDGIENIKDCNAIIMN